MRIIDYNKSKVKMLDDTFNIFTEEQRYKFNLINSAVHNNVSVIDRTNTLDIGIPYKSLSEIPSETTDKTLEEIINSRALELVSLGKKINVLWSGGIDSTVALIYLIRNNADLHITLTKKSLKEYQQFYDDFILDKIDHTFLENTTEISEKINGGENQIIVTGEIGDQILGSQNILNHIDSGGLLHTGDPWEDYVYKYSSISDKESYIEKIKSQLNKCPFKIVDLFDYYWWVNFTSKWNQVVLRIAYKSNKTQDLKNWIDKTYHFYATEDFQKWSLTESNHKNLKIRFTNNTSITDYKFYMKELIRKFVKEKQRHGDHLGLISMFIKVPSLTCNEVPLFVFENYRVIQNVEDCTEEDFEIFRTWK